MIWTGLGIVLCIAVMLVLHDHRRLQRYPYLMFLGGLILLLLPLMPGIGHASGGARIWIRVAGFSFQPAEIAKILLAIAFAAYFYEKREVLALAGRRFLGFELPAPATSDPSWSCGSPPSRSWCSRTTSAPRCCSSACSP
nr:FtsW/RodA/SpoVE family cell cycle protein [Tessaracoccus coleopterorum]